MTTKIIGIILIIILTSCQRQSSLTFHLKNLSQDNKDIPLKVTVGGTIIYNDKLTFNPDTNKYVTVDKDVPIGKYIITVTADSGLVMQTNPLMADLNRTILVTYKFNSHDTLFEKTTDRNNDSVTIARYANKRDAKLNIQIIK